MADLEDVVIANKSSTSAVDMRVMVSVRGEVECRLIRSGRRSDHDTKVIVGFGGGDSLFNVRERECGAGQ